MTGAHASPAGAPHAPSRAFGYRTAVTRIETGPLLGLLPFARRTWPVFGIAAVAAGWLGGSSCRCRPAPAPASQAESDLAPASASDPAAASSAAAAAEAPPRNAAARPPVQDAAPPAIDAVQAKLAAYRVFLDDADLTFHALRISWPGARPDPWRWPSWLSSEEAGKALDTLDQLGDTPPRIPAVDDAARRYLEIVRPELARWQKLVVQASDASRWLDEVVASFDRFVAVSRALRDAVAAVPEPEPAPRSLAAVVKACRVGSDLTARATWFAQLPAEAGAAAPRRPASTVELEPLELHRAGLACYRAALAYLEERAPDDYATSYDLRLHVTLGMMLLDEAERRSQARRYLSALPRYAQNAAYEARRRLRLAGH